VPHFFSPAHRLFKAYKLVNACAKRHILYMSSNMSSRSLFRELPDDRSARGSAGAARSPPKPASIDFARVTHYSPPGSTEGDNMKVSLSIVGVLLILMGGVWFLQGISVLPGSFMSGQIRWAVYGGIAVAAGILLLVAAKRRL
jgi:hypothetical protein